MIISLVGSSGDICGFQWQSRPLALENLVIFLIESIHSILAYYFMDWRHMTEILSAGQEVYTELLNLCVWAKSNRRHGELLNRSSHGHAAVGRARNAEPPKPLRINFRE